MFLNFKEDKLSWVCEVGKPRLGLRGLKDEDYSQAAREDEQYYRIKRVR